MRRGVLSSYLRHITEWTAKSRHIDRWLRNTMTDDTFSLNPKKRLPTYLGAQLVRPSRSSAIHAASWLARGDSIVRFQKRRALGQAHHDSPPGQSNGANRTHQRWGAPRWAPWPGPAAFLREKKSRD
ncbi:hypothetical protein V492_05008 [Pseudogymnoascus sp. VKM F-4246]|nr:hypothetical protein V492_05008 [Pseudogymnoascus sp. VKM F-4246]